MPAEGFHVVTIRDYAKKAMTEFLEKTNKGRLPGKQVSQATFASDAIMSYIEKNKAELLFSES